MSDDLSNFDVDAAFIAAIKHDFPTPRKRGLTTRLVEQSAALVKGKNPTRRDNKKNPRRAASRREFERLTI